MQFSCVTRAPGKFASSRRSSFSSQGRTRRSRVSANQYFLCLVIIYLALCSFVRLRKVQELIRLADHEALIAPCCQEILGVAVATDSKKEPPSGELQCKSDMLERSAFAGSLFHTISYSQTLELEDFFGCFNRVRKPGS